MSEIRDLKKDGRNIPVTEENKKEYVKLVCQMKMTGAITKQIESFLAGFYDIIPKRLISIFDEQELELLISGLPNIDLDDLKANTEYHKYTENSLQVFSVISFFLLIVQFFNKTFEKCYCARVHYRGQNRLSSDSQSTHSREKKIRRQGSYVFSQHMQASLDYDDAFVY